MKILVNRNDCHGDILAATSVLLGLQEKYPDAEIHFQVGGGYSRVLQNNPRIDQIILGRDGHYDVVIPYLDHHSQWSDHMPRVHCRIAGVPFNPPELYLTEAEFEAQREYKGYITVANQAGWKTREYEHMQIVVDCLKDKYPMVQNDLGDDMGIAHPRLSLREAAAVMAQSKLYLGIDTVFLHMAAALQKPMVSVMGQTCVEGNNYSQYAPYATEIRGTGASPKRVLDGFMTRVDGFRRSSVFEHNYTDIEGRLLPGGIPTAY